MSVKQLRTSLMLIAYDGDAKAVGSNGPSVLLLRINVLEALESTGQTGGLASFRSDDS